MSDEKTQAVGGISKADLLSVGGRERAVKAIADAPGMRHADVIALVQAAYLDASLPVPTLADIDWWLDDASSEVRS